MKEYRLPRPTEAELEILQILWQHGPGTVRFVNDKLNETKEVGYTTTLKLMQIMYDKNLLERDESQRSHIYQPSVREEETQEVLVDKLLHSAFGGSALKLVMNALGNHKTSQEEISQIRQFLDNLENQETKETE